MFSKEKDFFGKSSIQGNRKVYTKREIDNNITKSNWEKKSSFGSLGLANL